MTNSRRSTRVLAWGAAVAVCAAGLSVTGTGSAFAATPGTPGGLAPATSSTQLHNTELTWQAVSGATSYELRLVDAEDTVMSVTSTNNRYTLPTTAPRGNYDWNVRAVSGSTKGAWSTASSFVNGWSAAPTGLTKTDGIVPTLRWNPIPDASFYEVEISDRPFSAYPDIESGRMKHWICYTTHTTFTPYGVGAGDTSDPAPGDMSKCAFASDALGDATETDMGTKYVPGSTYYWRVRGRDGSVDARTTPFSPATLGCTGVWDDTGATHSGGMIHVPIPDVPPTYAPVPACSDWSANGPAVVAATPDASAEPTAAPTGLEVGPTPAGASSATTATVTASPVFSWDPVVHAFKYRVYLSRTADFKDSDVVWETHATSLAPVSDLALGTAGKFWTVQACLALCGPPAPAHVIKRSSTTTVAPISVTGSANGSTLFATWTTQDEGIRLGSDLVSPRAAAKFYQVRFTSVDTGDVVRTINTDRVAAASELGKSHLLVNSSAFPDGKYTFAVRAATETQNRYLPWSSESAPVLVDRAAPTVKLAGPTSLSGRTPVKLAFSEYVTGVTSSSLKVQLADGNLVSGALTGGSANTWTFTPSATWPIGATVHAWVSSTVKDRAAKPASALSNTAKVTTVADSTAANFTWLTGDSSWRTASASDAYGKSFRRTVDIASTSKHASGTIKAYGTSVKTSFCKSPSSGYLRVYVDGRLKANISQYRSWTGCGSSYTVSGLSRGLHTVVLQARASGSRGNVTVDRVSVG